MSSWRQANWYFHFPQLFYHFSIFISRYFWSLLYLRPNPLSVFQVLFNYNLLCFIHLIRLELLFPVTTFLTLHGFTATIVRCGLALTVLIILIILTLFISERALYYWMLSILIPRVIASTPPCGKRVLLEPDAATPA